VPNDTSRHRSKGTFNPKVVGSIPTRPTKDLVLRALFGLEELDEVCASLVLRVCLACELMWLFGWGGLLGVPGGGRIRFDSLPAHELLPVRVLSGLERFDGVAGGALRSSLS